jgi:UDP-glucose 4-epimerase
MSNVLITGSAGFIGSHLYNWLKDNGHKVLGVDNYSHPSKNDIPTEYCDVRSYKELLPYFHNCDIVFHLAAQISVDKSIYNPEETIATNILGTQNILELARKHETKVVFASSSEVYGTSQAEYMGEDHPLDPMSPYGASKLASDRLCYSYYKTYGMDVVVVRNFNTFGEYQSDDSYGGAIAKFTKAALRNEFINIYGDGNQERDYMHVSDAVQAYDKAMYLPAGSVVNFGSGQTVRINDLAAEILRLTKSSSGVIHLEPRKGEVQRLCADITIAKSFGFTPKTDFWKDLEKYIEWMKSTIK